MTTDAEQHGASSTDLNPTRTKISPTPGTGTPAAAGESDPLVIADPPHEPCPHVTPSPLLANEPANDTDDETQVPTTVRERWARIWPSLLAVVTLSAVGGPAAVASYRHARVVHDADGHDYFHGVRPLWAAKEVAAAAGPEGDTVKEHLNHLARRGAVEGPVTVSCHCVDKRFRELDLEAVDKAEEVGQAVHQGYYRLTDVAAKILAAHPLAESETPTPRTPPWRQPLRDW